MCWHPAPGRPSCSSRTPRKRRHQFKALVFFIGGNDIWGTPEDKSPDEFRRLRQYLIGTVREKYPETPIFFIEVTPIRSRWHLQPQVAAGNAAIEAVCEEAPDVYFIEIHEAFSGPDGEPRVPPSGSPQAHQGYSQSGSAQHEHAHHQRVKEQKVIEVIQPLA